MCPSCVKQFSKNGKINKCINKQQQLLKWSLPFLYCRLPVNSVTSLHVEIFSKERWEKTNADAHLEKLIPICLQG